MKTAFAQIAPILVLASLCAAVPAAAQTFGQFGELRGLAPGKYSLGAYLSGNGDQLVPTFELRGDLGRETSAGLQGSSEEGNFGMQGDLRKALYNTGGSLGLDLGGQAAVGFVTGNGESDVFAQLVPGASGDWRLGGSQYLSAWTGVGLRFASGPGSSTTHGLFRLGGRVGFTPELGVAADLEDVGGDSRLAVGVDYFFRGGRSYGR